MAEAKQKTKKVVMIVRISGDYYQDGKAHRWPNFGEEVELPADEADALIRNSQAVTPAEFKKLQSK